MNNSIRNWDFEKLIFCSQIHLFNKEVFGSDSLDYGDVLWGDIEFIMVNHLEFGKVVKSDWQFSNSIFQCHNSFIRSGLFATIFHHYLILIRLFNFQEEWNSETFIFISNNMIKKSTILEPNHNFISQYNSIPLLLCYRYRWISDAYRIWEVNDNWKAVKERSKVRGNWVIFQGGKG